MTRRPSHRCSTSPARARLGAAALAGGVALAIAAAASGAAFAAASTPAAGGKAAAAASAKPQGKPGSGVTVTHAAPAKIAIGETVTVRLRFAGVTAADGATVEVRDPATKVTLLSTQLAQGEQRTVDLPYTGRSDGMQYLDVTTTQGGRSTVVSVPLAVGSGQLRLKAEGERRTTADGEAVISLPATSPGSR
ncbi:MAG: hypothetical protein U1F25_13000 [Rubrivivax sp.]